MKCFAFKRKNNQTVTDHDEAERLTNAENDNIEDYDDLSFILDYIGSDFVSEAKSAPILLDAIKVVKKTQHVKPVRVDFVIKNGILKVTECQQGALIITAPSYAIALCARDEVPGFETSFGINITRKRIHMCHVFQAGSELEVFSITRAIALSFRCVAKGLRKIENENNIRLRSDSMASGRTRSDTFENKEPDFSFRRYNKTVLLPTLPSEDNLNSEFEESDNSQIEYALVHRTGSSSIDSSSVYPNTPTDDSSGACNDDDDLERISLQESQFIRAVEAISRHDSRILLRCVDEDEILNMTDKSRHGLLHYAVKAEDIKMVRLILKRGADVNIEGPKDRTPLHLASLIGNRSIAKQLLNFGANVRAKDRSYQTPLHLCAGSKQKLELSFLLIEHGAHINDNDLEGVRPSTINTELREMQNRLVQSASDAFAGLNISDCRSLHHADGIIQSGSAKSLQRSPIALRKQIARYSSTSRSQTSSILMNRDEHPAINPMQADSANEEMCGSISTVARKRSVSTSFTDPESSREHSHSTVEIDGRFPKKRNLCKVDSLKKDPVTEALHLLVNLSANSECHAALLSHLCLSKPAGHLVTLAHYTHRTNLQQISKLLSNMFNVNGAVSRQKCITAGLLKTVVDLLDSPEPLQSSCLSILNDILQQDGDRDYSNTISGIQVEILLAIIGFNDASIEHIKPSTSFDSGYRTPLMERRPKIRSFNGEKDFERFAARSNSLRMNSLATSDMSGQPTVITVLRKPITRHASLLSVNNPSDWRVSECRSGERHLERLDARRVAMKMLAATSRNVKLQDELAKPHMLNFLSNCLNDSDTEIVLHATIALANISVNIEKHLQLEVENIDEHLCKMLQHANPGIKYHAARALVYMGHVDLKDVYVFDFLPDEKLSPTVVQTEENGRRYMRGISLETLVVLLTTDVDVLYGGAAGNTNESQIIDFVIHMHQTFVHSVVFMRLLIHCFHQPTLFLPFKTPETSCLEHYAPLPVLHARLMRIWIVWLEKCPEDFNASPTIKAELSELIQPMRAIDGPYTPCADQLQGLLAKAGSWSRKNIYLCPTENHHNILYDQCCKAVRDGSLPCCENDFVYLAGLQLYIEDLCMYGQDFPQRLYTVKSINNSRLKHSIGIRASSSKVIGKKIRASYEGLLPLQLSERNSKHNYVNCCQGMPGYGCTFFKVKQCVNSNRRKKIYTHELLGVGAKRVVMLDERTKECQENFNSRDLRHWYQVDDGLTLKIIFNNKNCGKTFDFQLENRICLKELSNHILTCIMSNSWQGYRDLDTNPWSKLSEECATWGSMALQVHSKSKQLNDIPEQLPSPPRERSFTAIKYTGCASSSKLYSQSVPSKSENLESALEVLSFLNLKGRLRRRGDAILSVSPHNAISEEGRASSEESLVSLDTHNERCISSQAKPLVVGTRTGTSLLETSPSNQNKLKYDCTKKTLTCNCPLDANLPNLNLREFSAYELLDHPRELARQITLIDHEMFCNISSKDVLYKVSLGLMRTHYNNSKRELTVAKVADRFNQLSNWVVTCIVSESNIHRRVQLFVNFVQTAKQCLELHNYNAVMAITVAGLCSTYVRRLTGTRELIPFETLDALKKIEGLMESKRNHKRYRTTLNSSPSPAVPYFGIYLTDLTFICDGNPDYLKGGIVNLSKRRQVYSIIGEIKRFQRKKYNFEEVIEIKKYLLGKDLLPDDQLFAMSKKIEPSINTGKLGVTTPPVPLHSNERRGSVTNIFKTTSSSKRKYT